MLDLINSWLISIVDVVMSLWPSTPDAFKLSALLGGLKTSFPLAPWYLLGKMIDYAKWLLGGVLVIKVFKIIWP